MNCTLEAMQGLGGCAMDKTLSSPPFASAAEPSPRGDHNLSSYASPATAVTDPAPTSGLPTSSLYPEVQGAVLGWLLAQRAAEEQGRRWHFVCTERTMVFPRSVGSRLSEGWAVPVPDSTKRPLADSAWIDPDLPIILTRVRSTAVSSVLQGALSAVMTGSGGQGGSGMPGGGYSAGGGVGDLEEEEEEEEARGASSSQGPELEADDDYRGGQGGEGVQQQQEQGGEHPSFQGRTWGSLSSGMLISSSAGALLAKGLEEGLKRHAAGEEDRTYTSRSCRILPTVERTLSACAWRMGVFMAHDPWMTRSVRDGMRVAQGLVGEEAGGAGNSGSGGGSGGDGVESRLQGGTWMKGTAVACRCTLSGPCAHQVYKAVWTECTLLGHSPPGGAQAEQGGARGVCDDLSRMMISKQGEG